MTLIIHVDIYKYHDLFTSTSLAMFFSELTLGFCSTFCTHLLVSYPWILEFVVECQCGKVGKIRNGATYTSKRYIFSYNIQKKKTQTLSFWRNSKGTAEFCSTRLLKIMSGNKSDRTTCSSQKHPVCFRTMAAAVVTWPWFTLAPACQLPCYLLAVTMVTKGQSGHEVSNARMWPQLTGRRPAMISSHITWIWRGSLTMGINTRN